MNRCGHTYRGNLLLGWARVKSRDVFEDGSFVSLMDWENWWGWIDWLRTGPFCLLRVV